MFYFLVKFTEIIMEKRERYTDSVSPPGDQPYDESYAHAMGNESWIKAPVK